MALIVFTDLDGTLLDHDSYSCAAAQPALDRLRAAGIPLVLASSKTAAEIAVLHDELGLGDTPAIVENGAGVFRPEQGTEGDDAEYRAIRDILSGLPAELRGAFRGFGDMYATEIAGLTGLPTDAAARAARRQFSEPGLWSGDAAGEARFIDALRDHGVTARRGGRFLTLSFGRTKADAMAEVARGLRAETTIALGDAPNDLEMLVQADHGILVRNDHAPPIPDLPTRITRTDLPGPQGWNAAMLALIDRLTGKE